MRQRTGETSWRESSNTSTWHIYLHVETPGGRCVPVCTKPQDKRQASISTDALNVMTVCLHFTPINYGVGDVAMKPIEFCI